MFVSSTVSTKSRFPGQCLKGKWNPGTDSSYSELQVLVIRYSSIRHYLHLDLLSLFLASLLHLYIFFLFPFLWAYLIESLTTFRCWQVWDLEHRQMTSKLKWESNITAFSIIYGTSYMYNSWFCFFLLYTFLFDNDELHMQVKSSYLAFNVGTLWLRSGILEMSLGRYLCWSMMLKKEISCNCHIMFPQIL